MEDFNFLIERAREGDRAAFDRIFELLCPERFGGMEDAEIAELIGVSRRTVSRDWDKARLLLVHALQG